MGANTFETISTGPTGADAFRSAVESARYEYGHGGYTGSIAEKGSDGYVNLTPAGPITCKQAQRLVGQMIDNDDPRISDKWGPAGGIQIKRSSVPDYYKQGVKRGQEFWLFFGWASS